MVDTQTEPSIRSRAEIQICRPEAQRAMKSSDARVSFGDLALPLLPALYRHAVWLCRDHAEAEDLVQETLSKALRGFDSFEPGTNFKAWIFRVLRNSFLTSRTGLAIARTVSLEDHPGLLETTEGGLTPEDHLIRLNDQAAVHQALEQLQPQLREAILLCDLEDLKYKEIAQVLDIPIGTVMSRIARGRRALYQLLQPQFREFQ
jgi:RNA polymerase sigma-70 factor (ECF subfamily)